MAILKRIQKLHLVLAAINGPWVVQSVVLDGTTYKPKQFQKLREEILQELANLDIIVNI
jgi:hypothetical protein